MRRCRRHPPAGLSAERGRVDERGECAVCREPKPRRPERQSPGGLGIHGADHGLAGCRWRAKKVSIACSAFSAA